MALHELCTNAVKYGSLSVVHGYVSIVWRIRGNKDGDGLCLTWTERGGPAVSPPTRKGFGSRLIERGLPAELGGTVTVAYEAEGVVCTIDAPLPAALPTA